MLIVLLSLASFTDVSIGQTRSWTGGSNGAWTTRANWGNATPQSTWDVQISNGGGPLITGSSQAFTVNTLYIINSSFVNIASGGSLAVTDNGGYSVSLDYGGNVTVTDAGSSLSTAGTLIIFTGSFNVLNGASATASSDVSLAGLYDDNVASLRVGGANSLLSTGYIDVGGGGTATLTIDSGGAVAGTDASAGVSATSGNGSITVSDTNSRLNLSGSLTLGNYGSGSMTVSSGGAVTVGDLTLGADSAAGKGTLLVTGATSTLTVNNSVTLNNSAAKSTFTIADGATATIAGYLLAYGSSEINIGTGGLAGNLSAGDTAIYGTINFNHTDNIVFSTPLSFYGGTFNKSGSGKLTLTGTTSNNSQTFTANLLGGSLQIGNGGTSGTFTANIVSSASTSLIFNRSDNLTYSYRLSGAGALVQAGSGVLTLSGANTHTGGTRIEAGTLAATNASALGSSSTGTLTLAGGTFRPANNSSTTFNATNLLVTANSTIAPSRTSNGASVTQTLGTLSIGNSTLTVAHGSSFSSNNTGSLVIGATTLTGDAIFNLTNANGSATGTTTLGALNDGGVARTLTKRGAGALNLSTAATSLVAGTAVNIEAGTLTVGNATALGSLANVTTSSGAALAVGASTTLGALNGSAGSVTLGANTLTVGNTSNNLNSAFGGVISGTNGKLTKAGGGSLTLSGANTYTGATSVNAGSLFVNGSLANTAVTVAGGATLGGGGTIGGATLLASGSHLAPGAAGAAGTLTFANGLTFQAGSVIDFQVGDMLRLTSGTLNGPTSGTVTIALSSAADFTAGTYTLIDFTTAATGTFNVNNFVVDSSESAYTYAVTVSGGTLRLTVSATAVPEPATWAVLLGGAVLMVAMYRRRNRAD